MDILLIQSRNRCLTPIPVVTANVISSVDDDGNAKILMVKDFTPSPQIIFESSSLIWVKNGDTILEAFGMAETCCFPEYRSTSWAKIEIRYEALPIEIKSNTCYGDHIYDQPVLPGGDWSPLKTVLSRELNRAIDEELGSYTHTYYQTFLYVIFYLLLMSWKIPWCALNRDFTGVCASRLTKENTTWW